MESQGISEEFKEGEILLFSGKAWVRTEAKAPWGQNRMSQMLGIEAAGQTNILQDCDRDPVEESSSGELGPGLPVRGIQL